MPLVHVPCQNACDKLISPYSGINILKKLLDNVLHDQPNSPEKEKKVITDRTNDIEQNTENTKGTGIETTQHSTKKNVCSINQYKDKVPNKHRLK